MTHTQDDRASLTFILSLYAVGVVIAYVVFKQIMIMVMVRALNSGAGTGMLGWLPDLIFAVAAVLGGAAYVFAYRRQTACLARRAAADGWISVERRGME